MKIGSLIRLAVDAFEHPLGAIARQNAFLASLLVADRNLLTRQPAFARGVLEFGRDARNHARLYDKFLGLHLRRIGLGGGWTGLTLCHRGGAWCGRSLGLRRSGLRLR